MTRPIEEVYAALAQKLWPACPVCGLYQCAERPDGVPPPLDLACGNGMLMVLEAMRERDNCATLIQRPDGGQWGWECYFRRGTCPSAWSIKLPEAVAIAALAALEAHQ